MGSREHLEGACNCCDGRQESFALIEQGRGVVGVRRANKFPIEALAAMIVLESVVYASRTIEWAQSGATVVAADEVDYATASIQASAPVLMRLAKEDRFEKKLQHELFQGALLAARHTPK